MIQYSFWFPTLPDYRRKGEEVHLIFHAVKALIPQAKKPSVSILIMHLVIGKISTGRSVDLVNSLWGRPRPCCFTGLRVNASLLPVCPRVPKICGYCSFPVYCFHSKWPEVCLALSWENHFSYALPMMLQGLSSGELVFFSQWFMGPKVGWGPKTGQEIITVYFDVWP